MNLPGAKQQINRRRHGLAIQKLRRIGQGDGAGLGQLRDEIRIGRAVRFCSAAISVASASLKS